MHLFTSARQIRFATALVFGLAVAQCASASESPTKTGRVVYTTGTATVRPAQAAVEIVSISERAAMSGSGQWQIARLDSALVSSPATTVSFPSAAVATHLTNRFAADAPAQDQVTIFQTGAAEKMLEPSSWTAALATLALALFFFLRRLT